MLWRCRASSTPSAALQRVYRCVQATHLCRKAGLLVALERGQVDLAALLYTFCFSEEAGHPGSRGPRQPDTAVLQTGLPLGQGL